MAELVGLDRAIDDITRSIAISEEIKQWARNNYGRDLKVYSFGINDEEMPAKEDCPYISVRPMELYADENNPQRSDTILISIVIHDDELKKMVDQPNIVECVGGSRIIELQKMIMDILLKIQFDCAGGFAVEGIYENTGLFPIYELYLIVHLQQRAPMGVSPMNP